MTKTIDALVEALEALNPLAANAVGVHPHWDDNRRRSTLTGQTPITVRDCRKALAAVASIKAALAQARAEQAEPVDIEDLSHSAYGEAMSFGLSRDLFLRYFKTIAKCPPAAPVAKLEPLMDEEVNVLWRKTLGGPHQVKKSAFDLARAVEAAHNSKLSAPVHPDHFPDAGKMVPQPVQAVEPQQIETQSAGLFKDKLCFALTDGSWVKLTHS